MFWVVFNYFACFYSRNHIIKLKFVFNHLLLSMLSYSNIFFNSLDKDSIHRGFNITAAILIHIFYPIAPCYLFNLVSLSMTRANL